MSGEPWFIWNPWSLFGVAAFIACTATGAFVWATRPDRAQNRRLAIQLFVEGIVTLAGPAGTASAVSDAAARVLFTVHLAGLFLIVPTLLRFVATIDTPLARPLTTRLGIVIPWLIAGAELATLIARPTLFIRGFYDPWWGGTMFVVTPLANASYALTGLAVTYSLVVAIAAYSAAGPGTIARPRAGWYALAFGFRDVLVLLTTTVIPAVYGAMHGDDRPIHFMYVWVLPVVEIIFVALMAYGVLRSQLFDIDLRLAAGLRRGTVGAVMLFAFFAAAELAERLVSEELGYVVGAFVAAAVIFVHKPLEHVAARLSRRVLPGADASPEYFAFRKLEVYMDAVEAAYEDGRISRQDRVILNRLRAKLGVEAADADRLEADVSRTIRSSR